MNATKCINTKKEAMKVSTVSIIVNVLLSLFKFIAGIVASSGAMISDAVHSASDVFSTFIVIIGVNVSSKEADEKHQYGHERMECVASVILSVVLFETGITIGIKGLKNIISGDYEKLAIPGILALIAAISSIIVKEWMYWYTRFAAKRINSGALMADAWHHRSDALSSVGALIGIGGAMLGYPLMDSLASVIICIFIIKAALEIFMDAMNKMVDKSCDEATVNELKKLIEAQEGVIKIDSLQTRLFGNKMYVDLEISVDGDLKLTKAHDIAERIHNLIEERFSGVKHCMVHVNPYEKS